MMSNSEGAETLKFFPTSSDESDSEEISSNSIHKYLTIELENLTDDEVDEEIFGIQEAINEEDFEAVEAFFQNSIWWKLCCEKEPELPPSAERLSPEQSLNEIQYEFPEKWSTPLSKNVFSCKICEKPYVTKRSAKHHEYTHLNSEELSQLTEENNIYNQKCEICNKMFFVRSSYTKHINSHNKLKQDFSSSMQKLEDHIPCSPDKLKDGQLLTSKPETAARKELILNEVILMNHQLSPAKSKSFKCSHCPKVCKMKQALINHEKSHLRRSDSLNRGETSNSALDVII